MAAMMGCHFTQLLGGESRTTVFVPLPGLKSDLFGLGHDSTDCILPMQHHLWRSLENRRYRDYFDALVLNEPRCYFVGFLDGKCVDEASAREPAGAEYSAFVRMLDTLHTAILCIRLGGLVSPRRVPWTFVDGSGMRIRHRTGRFRLYSSLDPERAEEPILCATAENDDEDWTLEEMASTPFELPTIQLDASGTESVASLFPLMIETDAFRTLPGFHRVCWLWCQANDPVVDRTSRLMALIGAFLVAFGDTSGPRAAETQRRASDLMATILDDNFKSAAFLCDLQETRNDIAHGRSDAVREIDGNGPLDTVRFLMRHFIVKFIVYLQSNDLFTPTKASHNFRALRRRFFHHLEKDA